ncbi:signal peptidase I [Vampirovibrio chlorellavorus]|uniref:signal peptidase I n=1 Tax=Vampirovibrio chlorellavorus TaxID=758823 RepID=UPI0026EF993D|nr:signal peptidase I [Vampirovibrio chlorellavorus]
MDTVRYSEDVKDAIHLAGKLAKKAGLSKPSDRVYFQALLMTHRPFNRLDSVLKELQASPRAIGKVLKQTPVSASPPSSAESLLATAETLAKASTPTAGSKTALVDVEHWLKAACISSDAALMQVVKQFQISPEKIDASLIRVKQKQGRNTALFLAKELIEVVVFVLFFLIVIKSFIGELRLIPSESMLPGLQVNDRLVIERVTRWKRPYQRGDVLVFYPPMSQLKKDPVSLFLRWTGFSGLLYKKDDYIDVAYIKRLIGLPGDTVEVVPGQGVWVNGKKLDEPYINEVAATCTLVKPEPYCGPVKIPAGQYYMMGDNRNQSLDSRYWGFARDERVIGRAVFRIWPLNRVGTLPPAPYQVEP